MSRTSIPVARRFWPKVERSGSYAVRECWLWKGAKQGQGYGIITLKGRPLYAHRWAYEDRWGAVAPGTRLTHTCGNRACVNPYHIERIVRASV